MSGASARPEGTHSEVGMEGTHSDQGREERTGSGSSRDNQVQDPSHVHREPHIWPFRVVPSESRRPGPLCLTHALHLPAPRHWLPLGRGQDLEKGDLVEAPRPQLSPHTHTHTHTHTRLRWPGHCGSSHRAVGWSYMT
jgi:hypothetical protein